MCVKFYCSVLFLSLCRLTNRCLILRFRNISYVHTITSIFTPLTWFRGDAWATSKKINHSLIYDHRTLSPMSLVRSNSPSPQIKIPRYQWLTTRDVTQNVVISSRIIEYKKRLSQNETAIDSRLQDNTNKKGNSWMQQYIL